MSDLNFGDHTNRSNVKNPLLSTAVLGLSLEELNHRAVLLPAAPQPSLITGQDSTSHQQTQKQNNQPHNPILTNHPPPPPNLNHPPKTNETFDVNEYFARLEGTRYVSAPINAEIPDKTKLEVEEQNLEEVNLNDTVEDNPNSYHQSITSDIAQNFSQLPNVLPQMASAVFSSFSNMLNMSKKEVAEVQTYVDEGFKKVDLNADDLIGEAVKKDVPPPPKESSVGSTANTYRITTKKKAYAHIPGLSSNQPAPIQNNAFNPPPSQLNHNYLNPNNIPSNNPVNTHVIQNEAYNAALGPGVDSNVINLFDQNKPNQMNNPSADYLETLVKSEINANVFNVQHTPADQHTEPIEMTGDISRDVMYGQQQPFGAQDANPLFRPPQVYHPATLQNQMDSATAISKPPMTITSELNLNATATPIIPPPTMFSSPHKAEANVNRSILPPSVANRFGRNRPVVRNSPAAPAVEANIFVPTPLSELSPNEGLAASFPPPPMVPGVSGTNEMHVPSSVYAPSNITSSSTHNIFTPTFDGTKLESSSLSAFATTTPVQNITEAGLNRQIFDPTALAITSAVQGGLTESRPVPSQNLVEAPKQYDSPANPPMRFDPAEIIKPIVEPPKPVPEPPKLPASNVNFRLNKKRPQYYSGPIEGVGAISNNFKPIIGPTDTNTSQSTFHGALFTPPVSFSDGNTQANQDMQSTFMTPNYHHITPTIAAHQRDLNEPTAYDYRYEHQQTNIVQNPVDYSRHTTDYYDESKTENKGFGIIGSLKSKLSAIDINKIQNTVTTFFDPAYNDGVKNESVTDDNDSYRSQSDPSKAGDNSSLEIFVPSMDAAPGNQQPNDPQNVDYRSQYSTYFGNNNFTNQGHYKTQNESYQEQQFYTGSYYTESLSENNPNVADAYINVGPSVGFDPTMPVSAESNYIPENVQNQNIDVCAMAMARQQNEAIAYNATGFVPQDQNEQVHSTFQGNIEEGKQRDNDNTVNKTESMSPNKLAQVQMINPMDFFNQHHDSQGTFKSDILQQNIYTDPLPNTSNIDINKHENVKSHIEDVSAFLDKKHVEPPLTASGFFNKNEGQNLSDTEPRRNSTYADDMTTPKSVSLSVASRVVPNPVSPSIGGSTSDFLMQSVKVSEIKSTTSSDFVSPFNISATPLINLSTLLAEKSMTQEFEDPVGSFSRSHEIVEPNDEDEFDNSQIPVVMSDSVKEIDICETCREVNKEDDSENDDEGVDLTTQLIKNIISPIQLHNPVVVPFPETNEIPNNLVFDVDKGSQISLMTTSTIGAIHSSSVTDLIDDDDIEQFDKTLKITSGLIGEDCATPYGWKQSSQLGQDSNIVQESAFSFQPNVSAIGFYGDNSVFFDQTPNKPSDELIAGLNLNILDQNTVISKPSAPKIEDLDDTTGDMTEGIDVQLIEQDAKTDFEEFVVEPPERDDDNICKEKENSKEAVKDTSSFTERVEEFKSHEISSEDVFPRNTSSNLQQTVLRTEFTSPTTMASYFDTGNYAADAHYRKSVTSPSSASSFEVGSPKQNTAMASVTTSNIQILPSIIPPNEKDDNSIQVPLTKGIFTLESLSDQRIDSTVGQESLQAAPISSAAYIDISNNEMLNVFPDLIRDTKQSGDCLPQYNMPDFSTNITSNPIVEASVTEANVSAVFAFKGNIEASIDDVAGPKISQIIKPQPIAGITQHKLEDPMAFFQTEPKIDQSESSCNRLASYFSSPPKCEQSKSFFELSQSQNHLRQNPETNKKEYKTFYELSQASVHEKVQPPTGSNQTDVKVTPFNLFNDLTSVDNYTPTEEQTTRQVNYFTVEYDLVKKNLNRENNIGEPNVKAAGCSKSINENDNKHKNQENIDYKKVNKTNHPNFSSGETSKLFISENKPKNIKDELKTKTQVPTNLEESDSKTIQEICFLDVIKACKKCNSLFSDHLDRVNFGSEQVLKLRKAMDTESNSKPAQGDVSAESPSDHLKVSFEYIEEEGEDEKFSIITDENRQNAEYVPVKYHWFYRVDNQGKSVWRGFSVPDSQALEEAHNSPSLDENTLVPTDGGRFDVNVMGRLRLAVYWDEKPTNVRRCSWFYKGTTDARYVPYTESVAERLEEEYRKGVTTGTWHRRLVLSNNEAVIMHTPSVCVHIPHSSPAERTSHRLFSFSKNVYRNPIKVAPVKEQPTRIDHLLLMIHGAGEWRNQKQKIQSTMRPRVVRRGIDESEIEDTAPSRIDHLLLLCHGVGSACDMKFRSVEQVVDDFRMTSVQLIQAHYKSAFENGDIGRIEVLPIAWHSSLHSGESGVDKRLSMITLDSIPLVRSFTNDAVLDVLFYTSPKYCQTIIDTVCAEMNRIYTLFMSRNQHFYGGVSLGGHSLGSVILYDLLCHQTPIVSLPNHTESLSFTRHLHTGTAGTGQPQVKYPQLVFHPCAFYALGSPIAIFECIRGVDELGEDFVLPTCPKFYNIFHPYDPIAYRIEPLLNPRFKDIPPLLIPHHKGRKRMHLELKETMARVGADLKQKLLESIKTTWSNMWKTDANTQQRLEKVVEEEIEKEALNQEETGDITVVIDEKAEKLIAGCLNGGRRVDHVLQEAPLEMINEYLFAMSSHVCYWESEDTMLLILREVYDALGIQPDSTVPQQTMTVQRDTGLKDEKNNDEMDLPSTSSA